ncbi:glycosyltransferase family 39 protein [Acidianus sp. HS-5]|uniref:glycosyltransferase family 39 protein n=1 Tax=Acidianus sp. HS-5 TaxID=2886040 RepID=UPI001F2F2A30|nr:glycosyltransferase family 39 protein [Acidianus sp. HS-5]BDC18465.1 glycosyl transferase [Acidianus sp. HS-5]
MIRKYLDLIFYSTLGIVVAVYTYFTVKTFLPVNAYIGDEVWYPTAAYNMLKLIFHVSPPMYFPYPTGHPGICTFINICHPPLAKYIMDIFILIMGYSPLAWRIPSWIIGDLILITGFFFTREVLGKDLIGNLGGIFTAVILASCPNLWVLHGTAMLDIYVAFFSFLSLYFLLKNKLLLSMIFLGLAIASKEPAVMLIFPALYYIGEIEKRPIKRAYLGLAIPALVYIIVSLPIIIYVGGPLAWLHAKIDNTVIWDVSNGHISLNAVTQISAPWDWFLNIHPFGMGHGFYANVNPIIMILWAVTTPIAFIMKNLKMIITTMFAWSEWLGFVLVYILGNHTQFSFYVTDFAPFVDSYVVIVLFTIARKFYIRKEEKNVKENYSGGIS